MDTKTQRLVKDVVGQIHLTQEQIELVTFLAAAVYQRGRLSVREEELRESKNRLEEFKKEQV